MTDTVLAVIFDDVYVHLRYTRDALRIMNDAGCTLIDKVDDDVRNAVREDIVGNLQVFPKFFSQRNRIFNSVE